MALSQRYKILVGRLSQLAFFVDTTTIKGTHVAMQGALANALHYLVAAVLDPNAAVAHRALMHIEALRPTALKVLY